MSVVKTKLPEVDLDPILDELNGSGCGRYQLKIYALLLFPVILNAFFTCGYMFTAAADQHRCLVKECEPANTSNFSPSWDESNLWFSDECHRREADNSSWPREDPTCDPEALTEHTVKCKEFIYKERNTIVSEFNLACYEWKRTLVGTGNNIGQLLGMTVTGIVSDKFGRKAALIIGVTGCALSGLLKSFAFNYVSFVLLEVLDAFVGAGVYGSVFVLGVELVLPSKRHMGGAFISSFYSVGEIILAVIAWRLPYWRELLRALYIPGFIILAYIWLIPESIRWLVADERYVKAEKQLLKAAVINNVKLSDKCMNDLRVNAAKEKELAAIKQKNKENHKVQNVEDGNTETIKDAIRNPKLMLRVIGCSWMWITSTLLFYGLSLSSVALAGDKYSNFALTSFVEIPANMAVIPAMNYMGRKMVLTMLYWLGGLSCLAFAVIPELPDYAWVRMLLFLFGKFCISAAFVAIYVFTTELFPTPLRHTLLSMCSMIGRIGSIVAPQAPLLATITPGLPYMVFAASGLTSGLLVLFFPETKGIPLPNTIKECLSNRQLEISNKTDKNVTSL